MSAPESLPLPEAVHSLVDDDSYSALLGYPDPALLEGRAGRLASSSRSWFRRHARPWARARELELQALAGDSIVLVDGTALVSPVLARRLERASATSLVVALVSAGIEVDRASAELWHSERPDEAYFLDRFGAAVARGLATWAGQHLRRAARSRGRGVLPAYSPGFDGWRLADQVPLARSLGAPRTPELEVLSSGMMRPKNTLLAAFGVTSRIERAEAAWRSGPCSWCSLAGCGLRELATPDRSGA